MQKKALVLFFAFISSVLLAGPVYAVGQKVNVAVIDDYIIGPVVEEYIASALQKSEQQGACLIIKLNTPGGLLKSTQNIVKDILNSFFIYG